MNRLVFKIDPPNPARCPMCGERLIGQECTVVHDTVFCLFCDQTATPYEIEQTLFCANEPTMSDQWCTRLGLNIYCPSLYNPTAFMLPRFQLVDLDRWEGTWKPELSEGSPRQTQTRTGGGKPPDIAPPERGKPPDVTSPQHNKPPVLPPLNDTTQTTPT